MAKTQSRTNRWMNAASEARAAFEKVREAGDELALALQELRELQAEYEEWQGNLPENLEQSALGEKLQAVCDIDIESVADDPLLDWQTTENAIDEAEGADLPLGFGRD